MATDTSILDSDILIDYLRHKADTGRLLNQLQNRYLLGVTIISRRLEVLVGARNKTDQAVMEGVLSQFRTLPLDLTACDTADTLMRRYGLSHGLRTADCLIAATALAWNLPLLSKNQRDFRFIDGLNLLPYPPETAA